MEEQIERLRWQLRYLKRRLDEVEAERWRVGADEYEQMPTTWESVQLDLQDVALRAESLSLQAEIYATEFKIAHLTVAAQIEKGVRASPQAVSVAALVNFRDQVDKVTTQHRKNAKKLIRDARDNDLSLARSQGEDLAPIRAARKKKRQAAQVQAQAPVKRSRGLSR